MKIFYKERLSNGRIHIYFCGIKIASYKRKIQQCTPKINGKNNVIINPSNLPVHIDINGNNNKIIIEPSEHINAYFLKIRIGFSDAFCNNCVIHIGKNCSFSQTEIFAWDHNLEIELGEDCMFSWSVNIFGSDGHTIIDANKNINFGKYVKIGKHVWIGFGATILKNTKIADNCIIGSQSVVSGKFEKTNCIIAGNPAKIVKENINWDPRHITTYINDTK